MPRNIAGLRRCVAVLGAAMALVATAIAAPPPRPNILFVTTDDLGYGDIGRNGARDIPTPRIDQFAAASVRFTNGYVSASTCAPSRMGMLTGTYHQSWGVLQNHQGLPLAAHLVTEPLRRAGYRTHLVGKWHLGVGAGFHPLDRGFETFFGFHGSTSSYIEAKLERNRDPVEARGYLTIALADEAVKLIEAHAAERPPWFLMLNFNAPHYPMQSFPRDYEALGHIANPARRTYAAMVATLDREFGRVLDALERAGQERDTLVVFVNDNGGGGQNQEGVSNLPLRGGKYGVYEGGIKVPFFLRWPAAGLKSRDHSPAVSTLDLAPTFLTAAGLPSVEPTDGHDLLPALREGRPVNRALFWLAEPGERIPARVKTERWKDEWLAVRDADWKLHRRGDPDSDHRFELYDLARDPGERNDLARDRPEIVARLNDVVARWRAGFGHRVGTGTSPPK